MPDETQAGELYIDSLAVDPEYRGMGIAKQLLEATIQKSREMHLPATGLLVDTGNPRAELLYNKVMEDYQHIPLKAVGRTPYEAYDNRKQHD